MDTFLEGFDKVAAKVPTWFLKHLKKGGESGKTVLKSLGAVSKEVGSVAGQGVQAGGALTSQLGQLMQKYPGAVVPAAAGAYAGHRILSDKPKDTQYYYA